MGIAAVGSRMVVILEIGCRLASTRQFSKSLRSIVPQSMGILYILHQQTQGHCPSPLILQPGLLHERNCEEAPKPKALVASKADNPMDATDAF
ncbi:unnamed protein product [Urochloa humidicola]